MCVNSFTFYNDFIIKSKKYKKKRCLCFNHVKFTFLYISAKFRYACIYLHTQLFHMCQTKICKSLQSSPI